MHIKHEHIIRNNMEHGKDSFFSAFDFENKDIILHLYRRIVTMEYYICSKLFFLVYKFTHAQTHGIDNLNSKCIIMEFR